MGRCPNDEAEFVKLRIANHLIDVNIRDRAALWDAIRARLGSGTGFRLATINLDHLVKIRSDPDFADAYAAHDLVVADGRPVTWLSQLAGQPVQLLPGSDLVVPLCELAAENGWPVALIGSTEEALDGAATALCARVPALKIAHVHAPPMGFDAGGEAGHVALTELSKTPARLCFLALGAPKQEILAARGAENAPKIGFASIGAGLDFLSGHQTRAPRFMRALALEWLWRALSSPRRLIPRYLKCAAILPGLTLDALRQRGRG